MTMKDQSIVQKNIIFRMATLLSSHSLSVELQREEIATSIGIEWPNWLIRLEFVAVYYGRQLRPHKT
jgi:hypothetical protein